MQKKQRGFSLIELLIVVAIILIIASIAIPNLLNAKRSANETAAIGAIRAVNSAQISYNSAYPNVGYASTMAALGGTSTCTPPSSTSACLIDSQVASGTKTGYTFTLSGLTGNPTATYQIVGAPTVPNQTGVHSFCSYSDGVIRVQVTPITSCDGTVPPLQ